MRGVSLREIAASTKIGVPMLQAIEDDRFDKLPQGLFVRGFVREYARHLGLDEQKILTELSFHTTRLEEANPAPKAPEDRPSRFTAGLVNTGLFAGIAGLVVVLILSPSLRSHDPAPTGLPAVNAPAPSTSSAPAGGTQVAANGPAEAPAAASSGASVLPQPLQLTLTATEDCWIGLDVGGDRVENRVLKKGESFSIVARQNASLAVGNAGGLLVAIDSGPGRPLGNRGEVKRNIPLSPEALGALSAGTVPAPSKPIG